MGITQGKLEEANETRLMAQIGLVETIEALQIHIHKVALNEDGTLRSIVKDVDFPLSTRDHLMWKVELLEKLTNSFNNLRP